MKISQLNQVTLSQNQRLNIRLVMEHLGIENTTQNYLKFNKIYDWDTMAENIRHPKFDILCDIVYCGQACGRLFVEVQAADRASALLEIKNNIIYSSYEPVPE